MKGCACGDGNRSRLLEGEVRRPIASRIWRPRSVVRCGVFLADLDDFDGMDPAYADAFPEHPPRPARATIGAQLLGGIKVEIDAIAVV